MRGNRFPPANSWGTRPLNLESSSSTACAELEQALHPQEQRMWRTLLSVNIHRLKTVHRVGNERRVQPLGIGIGKPGVPRSIPLHRRANTVAITQINIIAHTDFITVVKNGSADQRH